MNTQKGFAPVLLILLGLVVIGGGAYYYTKGDFLVDIYYDETNKSGFDEVVIPDEEKVSETILQDIKNTQATISWKIYQSKELAFSLQIPENTKVREIIDEHNRLVTFEYEDGYFVVRQEEIGKYGESLDSWNFRQIQGLLMAETEVAGKRAFMYVIPAHSSGGERFDDEVMVITEHEGKVYHFEFHTVKVLTEIQNSILTSAQFLPKNSSTVNRAVKITSADLLSTTYPLYINDNGKAGSMHNVTFTGVGKNNQIAITRIGEAKNGYDPIEYFWIDSFSIDSRNQTARVYLLAEKNGIIGSSSERTFEVRYVGGKLIATELFSN